MQTYCGTPLNMAPEIMHGEPYTYKVDIWSIGVLLVYLLTGHFPFYATSKPDLLRRI
jgi:serine/threonine-protein kinase ULK/ATG1